MVYFPYYCGADNGFIEPTFFNLIDVINLRNKVLLIVIALTLTNCKQIAFTLYGIHKPREVSSKKLERKIEKYGLQADYNLALNKEGFMKYLGQDFSVNELLIYNQKGKLILPKDTNSCSSVTDQFVEYYKDSSLVNYVDTTGHNFFNQYFVNFDGSKATIDNDKPYLAVVYWASYTGRLNRNLSAKWVEELRKDKDVVLVCVSLDIQEFWTDFEIKYK